jgi:GNAT superfamily N-acetyltransferase
MKLSSMTATSGYPVGQSDDVALRDGSTVQICPIRAEDRVAVRAFLGGLSSESVGLRFFGAVDLDWAAGWSVDVNDADRYGLIATAGPEHTVVAHGGYVREGVDRAEVAFVVADTFHHLGLATILLERLAAFGNVHGIFVFTAVVLPYNSQMIDVFRDSGFPVEMRTQSGEMRVELKTAPAPAVRIAPWPSGGWAVSLHGHPTPVSRHDTEDEAQDKAASYRRGLASE